MLLFLLLFRFFHIEAGSLRSITAIKFSEELYTKALLKLSMDLSWIITALLLLFVGLLIIYTIYMSAEHGVFKKLGIPALTPIPVFGNFLREMRTGPFMFQEELYRTYKTDKASVTSRDIQKFLHFIQS